MNYNPGDSLAIFPINAPSTVYQCIELLQEEKTATILDKKNISFTLFDFLSKKANINKCNKKLISYLHENTDDKRKQQELEALLKTPALLEKFLYGK